MSTKIKGHRIQAGTIMQSHLEPNIKIPESQLELNHSTHSNEADLTVEQKNTMTLGGNADNLHHHAGGGGGIQGIYTNEERDAQLLKLSMLINSDIFGLSNAVIDRYTDASGVFFGYKHANSPVLQALTDDASFPGSLASNQEYSYGVSFKNKYGQTNLLKAASAITGDGFTNSIRVELNDVPTDNQGVSIYRTGGSTELLLVDELDKEWVNPHGLKIDDFATDKTTGISATALTIDKSVNAHQEILSESLSAVPDVSQPGNVPITALVPFNFYLISQTRVSPFELEILWDMVPSFAPRDYEVYYTKDVQITDFENANWQKFDMLLPKGATFKTLASSATDGKVEGAYRITNNTRPENKFHINPVEGITYLRIKVTRIDNLCRLKKVNLVGAARSQNRQLFLDTEKIDLAGFNTIKFDYKTTGYKVPFQVEAQRADEIVGGIQNIYAVHGNLTGIFPEVRDGHIFSKSYYDNKPSMALFNRIRVGFRVKAGSDFRGENFHLRITNGTSYTTPGAQTLPFYNIPVTFNGNDYYECENVDVTDVWSDWMYLPKSTDVLHCTELVFKSIRGQLQYHTNGYAAYSNESDMFLGYEDKLQKTFNTNGATSRLLHLTQVGLTNSVSKNLSNGFSNLKWHKGYMDIAGIDSLEYLKFFTGASNIETGTLILDNFTITRNKNILGPSVAYESEACTGGAILDVNSDDYGLNKYKRIQFNQYATVENPQIAMFTFTTEQNINQINFTSLAREKAPTNYVLQFSTDDSAKLTDSIGSSKWVNFTNVVVGEGSFDIGFEGSVKGSRIIANNIANTTLAHRFNTATVKKVRVFIEGTIGGAIPLIDNIEIYSAEDSNEMKLIFDTDSPVTSPRFVMVDDGLKEKEEFPPVYNTTGSFNIKWNPEKQMIELINTGDDGVMYTKVIPTDMFQDFMLSSQAIGDVKYEMSFDNGDSFVEVSLDKVNHLESQTDSVVIKITLNNEATLHAIAMLYGL